MNAIFMPDRVSSDQLFVRLALILPLWSTEAASEVCCKPLVTWDLLRSKCSSGIWVLCEQAWCSAECVILPGSRSSFAQLGMFWPLPSQSGHANSSLSLAPAKALMPHPTHYSIRARPGAPQTQIQRTGRELWMEGFAGVLFIYLKGWRFKLFKLDPGWPDH